MSRAVSIVTAVALDLVFADPQRWHPVAGFGRIASTTELALYGDTRRAGVAYVAVNVGVPVAVAMVVQHALRNRSILRRTALVAATWAALGGASLVHEGENVARLLDADDLIAARARLSYLCGRDPEGLDATALSRATIESLAENASDAVVAPLFWAVVAGLPGVIGYRAVNTLDAMVGYRSERYLNFGWATARLDDLANLVPARLTAVLACVLAPTVGGSVRETWRILRRDGGHHPSPNAGHPESAFAGALRISLGGVNVYAGVAENRGTLGDGPAPIAADIGRAAKLTRVVGWAAASVLAGIVGIVATVSGRSTVRPA